MTETTCIYLDTQDPRNPGWAWRHDGSSGPIDGDLPEDASLVEVLDQVCGSDVPLSFADPSLWRPIQGAKGWEIQASVQCESGRATGVYPHNGSVRLVCS